MGWAFWLLRRLSLHEHVKHICRNLHPKRGTPAWFNDSWILIEFAIAVLMAFFAESIPSFVGLCVVLWIIAQTIQTGLYHNVWRLNWRASNAPPHVYSYVPLYKRTCLRQNWMVVRYRQLVVRVRLLSETTWKCLELDLLQLCDGIHPWLWSSSPNRRLAFRKVPRRCSEPHVPLDAEYHSGTGGKRRRRATRGQSNRRPRGCK